MNLRFRSFAPVALANAHPSEGDPEYQPPDPPPPAYPDPTGPNEPPEPELPPLEPPPDPDPTPLRARSCAFSRYPGTDRILSRG